MKPGLMQSCTLCQTSFCQSCGASPWHYGLSCQDYADAQSRRCPGTQTPNSLQQTTSAGPCPVPEDGDALALARPAARAPLQLQDLDWMWQGLARHENRPQPPPPQQEDVFCYPPAHILEKCIGNIMRPPTRSGDVKVRAFYYIIDPVGSWHTLKTCRGDIVEIIKIDTWHWQDGSWPVVFLEVTLHHRESADQWTHCHGRILERQLCWMGGTDQPLGPPPSQAASSSKAPPPPPPPPPPAPTLAVPNRAPVPDRAPVHAPARMHVEYDINGRQLQPDRVEHSYRYTVRDAQHREWSRTIILTTHGYGGVQNLRFLCPGSSLEDHGSWHENEELEKLILRFNCKWPDIQVDHPHELTRRGNVWRGQDDKGCIIEMIHLESKAQYPLPTGWRDFPSL